MHACDHAAGSALAASPRIFENPLLDRMSRVHHFVPLVIYLPPLGVLLWTSARTLQGGSVAIAVLAGYLGWTLVEYLGHRFLFHFRPRGSLSARIHFLVHGVHHDHPNDRLRLVMPPLMSLPIMAAAFGAIFLICGATISLPVFAGFLIGYLLYDLLHFHVHHAEPRTAMGRFLRNRHMHHHFRDDASWFGVSAPWWDELLGTSPPRRSEVRK
ncbi:MAG TPA: sterol desaturase family protein [Rhizomicrobium sp.]|jgi:sterol desaturase/sphingolipid hydroxylase (fatty acid hydroxylase superfamily)